ncbi:MAG: hypothetical protein A3G21_20650 [Acidobacteria bacterium RIFCSPLOWO2_12_FULL_66_21]|nr:MAG: hypothetical protein A3G21_20650 [Acidobacteria bacterium RIFCSPLOWO2_12_FULL_66_21]
MHPILLLIAAALLTGPPQQATSQPSMVSNPDGSARTAAPADEDLPVSLDRIRRALARPPALDLRGKPVFRVEVFGRKPTIEDILGPDFLKGPVPYGGMTHQEFLNMVTPKDVQGYAAFTNKEGMTVAATSLALQWALQKAIHKFEQARNEREKEAARREVQDALADLAKARLKAGLPPK